MDEQTHDPIRHCYKESCGKLLTRRKGEPKSHFEIRLHCNLECSRTNPLLHQAQKDNYAQEREKETKVCPECGKTFSRTRNESRAIFEIKVCCTRACSDEKLRRERAEMWSTPKVCEICQGNFYRRKGTETNKQFQTRKTCGKECGNLSRSATFLGRKSPVGKKKASEYEKKLKEEREAKKNNVPPPTPQPQPTEVWRPASWGGPRKLEAS